MKLSEAKNIALRTVQIDIINIEKRKKKEYQINIMVNIFAIKIAK